MSLEKFFRGIQKGEGEMNIYFVQSSIFVQGKLFYWKQRNFICNCRAVFHATSFACTRVKHSSVGLDLGGILS